jgi:Secretion system C-terminal sorting domain
MKTTLRKSIIMGWAWGLSSLTALAQTPVDEPKVGIGLGGIGSWALEFVDVARTMRPFEGAAGGGPVPLDENGWPTTDARTVLFDFRPCCPWLGENQIDDPNRFVPRHVAGVYKISFTGQATVAEVGSNNAVENAQYNAGTNTTTADLVIQEGRWLVILRFTNTRLLPSSSTNSGIKDLKVLRPGYHNRPNQIFRDEYLNAVAPFPVIRYMDFTETNNYNPNFPGVMEWGDRPKVTQATFRGRAPWEYVVELANLTGKDLWINIPVAATDGYVRELANFIRARLTNNNAKIYLEYSNEVWNPGFTQFRYNREAAVAEVARETSGGAATTLNDDAGQCDRNDQQVWGGRRFLRRVKEIGDIFVEVFSPGSRTSFGSKIRPIFAWQIGGWVPFYSCHLTWFERVYGAGSARQYFYGLAGASYINANEAAANATATTILAQMRSNSNRDLGNRRTNVAANWTTSAGERGMCEIAELFGLRCLQYETGPDNGGGDATNVANRVQANRDQAIRDVVIHDLKNNWFDEPQVKGGLIMYFVHCSPFNRYGAWGATEDLDNLNTPKLQGVYNVMGVQADNTPPSAPRNARAELNNNNAVVTWQAATDNVGVSHYRVSLLNSLLATVRANEPLTVTLPNVRAANLFDIKVTALDAFNNESAEVLTALEDFTFGQQLRICPNPAQHQLEISIADAGPYRLALLTATGQVVREQPLETSGPTSQARLDLRTLPAGLYLLRLSDKTGTRTSRIVKVD